MCLYQINDVAQIVIKLVQKEFIVAKLKKMCLIILYRQIIDITGTLVHDRIPDEFKICSSCRAIAFIRVNY